MESSSQPLQCRYSPLYWYTCVIAALVEKRYCTAVTHYFEHCLELCIKGSLSSADEDIPTVHDTSNVKNSPSNIKDTNQGPLTRRRAKKLQEQVNSFLTDCAFMISKDVILPKCSTLVVLRCTHEERAPDRTQKSTRSDRTTSSDYQFGPPKETAITFYSQKI